MILQTRAIRPDETAPIDFPFVLPGGAEIENMSVEIYDRTDATKTDLPAKIESYDIFGNKVRVAFKSLEIGKFYHATVEVELNTGQTLIVQRMIPCAKYQDKLFPSIQPNERRRYTVDFTNLIPSGLSINSDFDLSTFTATGHDGTTGLAGTLIAEKEADERKLLIDFENAEAWKTYTIDMLLATTIDPDNHDTIYKVGRTVILNCKEM